MIIIINRVIKTYAKIWELFRRGYVQQMYFKYGIHSLFFRINFFKNLFRIEYRNSYIVISAEGVENIKTQQSTVYFVDCCLPQMMSICGQLFSSIQYSTHTVMSAIRKVWQFNHPWIVGQLYLPSGPTISAHSQITQSMHWKHGKLTKRNDK